MFQSSAAQNYWFWNENEKIERKKKKKKGKVWTQTNRVKKKIDKEAVNLEIVRMKGDHQCWSIKYEN